jgi:hypothetical protein
MSKIKFLLLLPALLFAQDNWINHASTEYWWHEEKSDFTIITAEWLAGLAQLVNNGNDFSGKTIMLGANIDLDSREWTAIGTEEKPFKGTFDGKGYVVSGLYINSEANHQGLFGYLGNGGSIENLGVTDSYVKGGSFVGGLVGDNNGTISNSYVTGDVLANIPGKMSVGGFVGWNHGTINNSYTVGNVSGNNIVGGLVGYNTGTINRSYASGNVSGNGSVGGLVGDNSGGTISNSYYDERKSGRNDTGKGDGKTTILMKDISTYESWDFKDLWDINPYVNNGLPYLQIFYPKCDETEDWYTGKENAASYAICTAGQLKKLAELVNGGNDFGYKTIRLRKDIELNKEEAWTPIGEGEADNTFPFRGTFDGNGHVVSGVYIDNSSSCIKGLFGTVGPRGIIKNLGVTDSYVKGNCEVGIIAGVNSGTIINSYATGDVEGTQNPSRAGVLVGGNSGEIRNCYANGNAKGISHTGGLVGFNSGGTINNSYAAVKVEGTLNMGGLVGINDYGGTISNSYYDKEKSGRNDNGKGIPKTTAEMRAKNTYAGWDFANIWDINSSANNGMPYLQMFNPIRMSCPNEQSDIWNGSVDIDWYISSENNYTICTAEQLAGLAELVNEEIDDFKDKTIVLGANIILNDITGWKNWDENTEDLNQWVAIGTTEWDFYGTFDGKNHVVSGVYISSTERYKGLFGYSSGIIKNLGVTASFVNGSDNVGGLIGINIGLVDNSYATGNAKGNWNVGGLVGYNYKGGFIGDSYATGNVEAYGNAGGLYGSVGGLVGSNEGSEIVNSYATGRAKGDWAIGGLIGTNDKSTVSNSYATGNVSGGKALGGLAGHSKEASIIENSYAIGNVSGGEESWAIGGLAGWNDNKCVIKNSYAMGNVEGSYAVGGLVGKNGRTDEGDLGPGTIENSYAAGKVTGVGDYIGNIGGLVGDNESSTVTKSYYYKEKSGQNDTGKGEGKTTAQMKDINTYIDWDFENIWGINSFTNSGMPYLKAFAKVLDPSENLIISRPRNATPILPPFGHPSDRRETAYYNLKGNPLGTKKPTTPGIYIEKTASQTKKVLIK